MSDDFYSSTGNPLGLKGLNINGLTLRVKLNFINSSDDLGITMFTNLSLSSARKKKKKKTSFNNVILMQRKNVQFE